MPRFTCLPTLAPAIQLTWQDQRFDTIVGALEEAVMDSTFASLQQSFVDEWCGKCSSQLLHGIAVNKGPFREQEDI